ncbi:Nucleoid occlusion factor SlmA [bioreactor metagenome]|jgi:Transcriptional regulator|uniref:Nucleoid occlusion factor SlmA n=1 Tax=bioreactor metagenome TaxID=1076179 RepID=A0A644VJR9_9ZZZZ|nr:TetR/AcrR family transcriptional regulator [Acidaminococcaceae bacterium]NLU44685.1 TetR/AcrR family transcriptional regulator [Acholeplasmataceae bacterium]
MKSRKSTEIRKEEIVQAALGIVEQNGLGKLNIQAIAARVELVPSAIYRHFKGRDEIVAALIEHIDKRLKDNLKQVQAVEGNSIVKLKELFELHVSLLKEEAAMPSVLYFLLSSERNPELKASMLATIVSYVKDVKEMLLQGQEKGEISAEIDAMAAAMMFLGLVQPLTILGQVNKELLDNYPQKLWQIYQRSITR